MAKKLTKSEFYAGYFQEYYGDVEKVTYFYRSKKTVVELKNGNSSVADLQKGDKWSFQIGFFIAYTKALRATLKFVNDYAYGYNN